MPEFSDTLEKQIVLDRMREAFPYEDNYRLGLATFKAFREMKEGATCEDLVKAVEHNLERIYSKAY